ncbi:MAG: DUF3108 domain-containing protein [Verrucomicrobiota bacterium]|nr:DUF3108 domain-containing protein [Verrucomicrobiota bacterium]
MTTVPFRRNFLATAICFALAAAPVFGQDWESTVSPHVPGPFPELRPVHVSYSFGWNTIPAATADLSLSKRADGNLQLDATGHTIGLARSLWRFDVVHVAVIDAHTLRPIQVHETESGHAKKAETEINFTAEGVISRRDEIRGGRVKSKTRHFEFPMIHGIGSALLYLRTQPPRPDTVQRIVVYPSTTPYLCTITPAGHEHISGPTGVYDAMKLELQLSKIGGKRELLPHKKFEHATVWISDDPNRLVLRIEARIFAGAVFAQLQSVRFDQ